LEFGGNRLPTKNSRRREDVMEIVKLPSDKTKAKDDAAAGSVDDK